MYRKTSYHVLCTIYSPYYKGVLCMLRPVNVRNDYGMPKVKFGNSIISVESGRKLDRIEFGEKSLIFTFKDKNANRLERCIPIQNLNRTALTPNGTAPHMILYTTLSPIELTSTDNGTDIKNLFEEIQTIRFSQNCKE